MVRHALTQPLVEMKRFIKPLGEKFEQGLVAKAQFINAIGPVNHQPAPYHHGQYREIDPVKPADGKGVFFGDALHCICFKYMYVIFNTFSFLYLYEKNHFSCKFITRSRPLQWCIL